LPSLKTCGMAAEAKGTTAAAGAAADDFKTGYVLFMSSVAANVIVEKSTDRVKALLGAQKVTWKPIDISINTEAKAYMQTHSTNAKPTTIPQVFKDGKYIGTADELDEANEDGALKKLLGAA